MQKSKRQLKIKNFAVYKTCGRFSVLPCRFSALNFNFELKNGFSLVEVVVYVGILGIIAVLTSNFLIYTVDTYNRARAEREVISNGRLILELVNKNISEAREVYAPTSVFNADAGQLSLMTSTTTVVQHATGYLDFWVDNGRFWMRREGEAAIPISSVSVKIARFRLERIVQSIDREAVRMVLQIDYNTGKSNYVTSVTLNSTTALRGNY